ncbi:hypothetical protein AHAS_Ahas01G0294700 [Arachis hypogaea]
MGRRVHVVGNLAFPTLITQLALKAGVEWAKDDEMPTIIQSKEVIPHGLIHHIVLKLFKTMDHMEYRQKRRYKNMKRQVKEWDPLLEEFDTPESQSKASGDDNQAVNLEVP